MKENNIVVGIVVLLLAVGVMLYFAGDKSGVTPTVGGGDGKTLALAQCLKDRGTVFYGAFWCPHCKQQKALFGSAEKSLPYVECSTPDGNSQNLICANKGIKSYPTWKFSDGSELTGEVALATLAEKSGCPWEDASAVPVVSPEASTGTTVIDDSASTTPL